MKEEKIDKHLKELEKNSWKNKTKKHQEEHEKKHYTKELKKVEEFLKKIEEKDFNRVKKHRYCVNDDPHYKGIR